MTTDHTTDFDGCSRECRKAGQHTLRWGGCEQAPEPEATVSMPKVYTDPADGNPSIGYDTYTIPELARLIETAIGDPLRAAAAARVIVHRNDEQSAAVLPPPVSRADVLREAADVLPEADLPFVPPMDRRRVADWLRRMADEAQPDTEADRTVRVVQCSRAILSRPHAPHQWEPQPGTAPVHCPGHTFAEDPS